MKALPFLLLTGCLGVPSASPGPDAAPIAPDADPLAPDADPLAPDADPSTPDADPSAPDADPAAPDAAPGPVPLVGRYILRPYFTGAGGCAEGEGIYNFNLSAEYTITVESPATSAASITVNPDRTIFLASQFETTVGGFPYRTDYTFNLAVADDGTVTGTGRYTLTENYAVTCDEYIDVENGYIQ